MRWSWGFVASTFLIVATGVGLTWSFVDQNGRNALLLAGVLVLVTQIPLHVFLAGWRSSNEYFAHGIVLGAAARLLLLVLSIIFVVIPNRVPAAPFLLALGGFLVAVLLTESMFQQRSLRSGADPA